MNYYISPSGELYHYGVKGMKWGVRRYQNKDGSLTKLGKKHKAAAIKGLEESKAESIERAKFFNAATAMNRKSLEESMKIDKETGETSWNTQQLRDVYKATGRAYVESVLAASNYELLARKYRSDEIKAGEDYVVKNLRKGVVELTESGRNKEAAIADEITKVIREKFAKEIEEYRP